MQQAIRMQNVECMQGVALVPIVSVWLRGCSTRTYEELENTDLLLQRFLPVEIAQHDSMSLFKRESTHTLGGGHLFQMWRKMPSTVQKQFPVARHEVVVAMAVHCMSTNQRWNIKDAQSPWELWSI